VIPSPSAELSAPRPQGPRALAPRWISTDLARVGCLTTSPSLLVRVAVRAADVALDAESIYERAGMAVVA
jgi:hypothetical protein